MSNIYPDFKDYPRVSATAPRLVCVKCKEVGKSINPTHSKASDLICPKCGYDNYNDPEKLY